MLITRTYTEAFEEAIREEPDDPAPRLIYADFLDERDDPALADRAEFIRVQCELERLSPADRCRPASVALAARERELRQRHGLAWAGPLKDLVASYEFRRGFVERIRLGAADFVQHADQLFQLAPLREVELTASASNLDVLFTSPYLPRVTVLDLNFYGGDLETLAHLSMSGSLTGLTRLRLRGLHGTELPQLGRIRPLPHLASLDLSCNALRPDDLAGLLNSPGLQGLNALSCNGCQLGSAGLQVLAESPLLTRLTSLDLRSNGITAAGVQALAYSPFPWRLRSLWLGFNVIQDAGLEALASASVPLSLTRLFVASNALHGAGVQALARAPSLVGLADLDLDYNDLSSDALESLAASPYLNRLQTLFLRCGRGLTPRTRQLLLSRFGDHACRF